MPITTVISPVLVWMAPYEALYGRRCRTPTCWTELDKHKIIGLDLVKDTEEKVQIIQQRLKLSVIDKGLMLI